MEQQAERDFPHKDITQSIIDAFYQVYRELGYGFSEAVYRPATAIVLRDYGLDAVEEQVITVRFMVSVSELSTPTSWSLGWF